MKTPIEILDTPPILNRHQTPLSIKIWWIILSLFLIKSILIDSWGYIDAGIGKLEIDTDKVLLLSLFPFLGLSWIVWKESTLNLKKMILITLFSSLLTVIGIVAHFYLKNLSDKNDIIMPSNQAIIFSLGNLILTVSIIIIFIWNNQLKIHS